MLAVEQADLDALAGQAGLVRGERAGGHQQVVLHALVAVVAGLGRARAAAVGARQRVRLRRRGRLAGLGRLRRGGSCRLGGSRRVGLGSTAATAGRQGQGHGERGTLQLGHLLPHACGSGLSPPAGGGAAACASGRRRQCSRADGGLRAAPLGSARTGGSGGRSAQFRIQVSVDCVKWDNGHIGAGRSGRLAVGVCGAPPPVTATGCGAAGAGAAGVGTQGGGEPGRREPGGGSAGGASSKGAAQGRGGEEPGAPTCLARCQGGTARARPDGRGAGGAPPLRGARPAGKDDQRVAAAGRPGSGGGSSWRMRRKRGKRGRPLPVRPL